jgi:hypothetical protein
MQPAPLRNNSTLCSIKLACKFPGRLAQLEERLVRNEEAVGSSPMPSTNLFSNLHCFPKFHELPQLPII